MRAVTRFVGNFWLVCGVKSSVTANFLKSLIAVVSGNLIYFLLLWPFLPPAGRHRPERIDLGLVIDFWVCLVIYGMLNLLWKKRGTESKT